MPLAAPAVLRKLLITHAPAGGTGFTHSLSNNSQIAAVLLTNQKNSWNNNNSWNSNNFLSCRSFSWSCRHYHSTPSFFNERPPPHLLDSLCNSPADKQLSTLTWKFSSNPSFSPVKSTTRARVVDPSNSIGTKRILGLHSPFKLHSIFSNMNAHRCIATQPLNIHLPPPPPREFNPDGSPKKYRLTQRIYDHKYDWERWSLMPAGVFHTVYYGEFGRDYSPFLAWLLSYPLIIASIPFLIFCYVGAYLLSNISSIGIKPKRYTIEWMEASKERDRAENTNPFTRYLDRRRKERGPNWLLEDYAPTHPHFIFIDAYYHDPELLREKNKTADDDE